MKTFALLEKAMENKTPSPTPTKKSFWGSRSSVVSFFAVVSFLLMIPLITLLAQEPQDIRERASVPIPSITSVLQQQTVKSVSGYVFTDTNQNGERESQERAYPGATIRVTKLNGQGSNGATAVAQIVSEVKTDANGYFRYTLPATPQQPTSYVIKLILPAGYKTIDTNPVVLSSAGTNDKEVVEFGLFPIVAPVSTGAVKGTNTINPSALPTKPSLR
jgi:hypothetical protein